MSVLQCLVVLCLAAGATPDDDAGATLKKAAELIKAGQYQAACASFREYLEKHPDDVPVRTGLADALAQQAQFPAAIQEYRTVLEKDPSLRDVRFRLAIVHYKDGNFPQAAEQLEILRASNKLDNDGGYRSAVLLADCYLRLGEDVKVIPLLEPLAAKRPDDFVIAYMLGTALLHDNQEARSAEFLQRITSRENSPEVKLLLAITKMRALDLQGALTDIRRCLELNPGLAQAHVVHGRLLAMTGDIPGAETAFGKALSIEPKSFDALLELGALAREQDKVSESHELLSRALAIRPLDVRARYQLALLESSAGNDTSAVGLLEGVVKDAPNFMEAHARLSALYFRLHRPEDSRREKEIADRLAAETQKRDHDRARQLH